MTWHRIDDPENPPPIAGTEFQAWCVRTDGFHGGWWEPRCRFDEFGSFQVWGRTDYDIEDWDSPSHYAPTHWMHQPPPPVTP